MDTCVLLLLGGVSFITSAITNEMDAIKAWVSFILGCLFVISYLIIRIRQLVDIVKKAKEDGKITDKERKVIMTFILESIVLFYKDMSTLFDNLIKKETTDTSDLDGKDK